MTLNDAYNVVETIEILSIAGIEKAKQIFDHLLIKSFLAGNEIGCLFYQYLLVYHAGLLSNEPYRSCTIKFAEIKGNIEWYEMFLKGIGIYLPICLFIAVGYEHSVVNMFTVQMGMLLGGNLSIINPVTFGNILRGTFFVGFIYSYLYLPKQHDEIISLKQS